jgi:hypothetical protein
MALGAVVRVLMFRRRSEDIADVRMFRWGKRKLLANPLEDLKDSLGVFIVVRSHTGLFLVPGIISGFGSENAGLGVDPGCCAATRVRDMTRCACDYCMQPPARADFLQVSWL